MRSKPHERVSGESEHTRPHTHSRIRMCARRGTPCTPGAKRELPLSIPQEGGAEEGVGGDAGGDGEGAHQRSPAMERLGDGHGRRLRRVGSACSRRHARSVRRLRGGQWLRVRIWQRHAQSEGEDGGGEEPGGREDEPRLEVRWQAEYCFQRDSNAEEASETSELMPSLKWARPRPGAEVASETTARAPADTAPAELASEEWQ